MTVQREADLKIPIIAYADVIRAPQAVTRRDQFGEEDATLGGIKEALQRVFARKSEIPATELRDRMTRFLSAMQLVFEGLPAVLGGYKIAEMEVQVEISAEGEVSLLGTGGKVGGKGSLTLKLHRID